MAACPAHPDAQAIDTCSRCGRFYCLPEQIVLDAKHYCGECGVRDDVDWLGKHYRKLEGTRSGLVWFVLLLGLATAGGAIAALVGSEGAKERGFFAGLLIMGLASLTPISGKPWSRFVLLLSTVIAAVFFVVSTGEGWAAAMVLPALLVSAATFTDVRTRLFFRLPVARPTLMKHFQREGSNPLAVHASRLALLGLFIPGVSLISLVMGVMALTRINSKAIPPVGNLSAALGAIVFSGFTSIVWIAGLVGRFS